MKDETGTYYYPFPDNKRVRMYVKTGGGSVLFRLWNADDPALWKEHGWVPYETIQEAIKIYEGKRFNPVQAYDLSIAKAVLREAGETI
jgi:hypothetical protein